jgi:hypothetical protein
MSFNPNGSEDNELKIKALDGIVVGDFYRPNVSQTEEQHIVMLGPHGVACTCEVSKDVEL